VVVIVVEPFREAEDAVVGRVPVKLVTCALAATANAARMAVVYIMLTGK